VSKTCSDVPISTVFCDENFNGISTNTASPAGSCTGVFCRNGISSRKSVRASRAGRLKWPIHWLSRYCRSFQWRRYWPGLSSRKASVAYLMALPLAWGLVWRIDWQRPFCQKRVVGWVRPSVSMQAHNNFSFQKDNRTGPKDHTVSHSYCFVVGLPGETATKHEANHSPPSSAEIKSASSYTSTLHLPVWRGA
jgi:hypothetical protein